MPIDDAIAQRANAAPTTVSAARNGRDGSRRIGANAQGRVFAVLRALDETPNVAAHRLRRATGEWSPTFGMPRPYNGRPTIVDRAPGTTRRDTST